MYLGSFTIAKVRQILADIRREEKYFVLNFPIPVKNLTFLGNSFQDHFYHFSYFHRSPKLPESGNLSLSVITLSLLILLYTHPFGLFIPSPNQIFATGSPHF